MQVLSPPEQIDFAHNKQLLNRYRFIEYETLRILAAWLPGTANMDWKLAASDVARAVVDLLRHPARSLPSRVELRPSTPRKQPGSR